MAAERCRPTATTIRSGCPVGRRTISLTCTPGGRLIAYEIATATASRGDWWFSFCRRMELSSAHRGVIEGVTADGSRPKPRSSGPNVRLRAHPDIAASSTEEQASAPPQMEGDIRSPARCQVGEGPSIVYSIVAHSDVRNETKCWLTSRARSCCSQCPVRGKTFMLRSPGTCTGSRPERAGCCPRSGHIPRPGTTPVGR